MSKRFINRRDFIRQNAVLGAGMVLVPQFPGNLEFDKNRSVTLGFIGVGGRGTSLLRLALQHSGVRVKAICDIDARAAMNAADIITEHGQRKPELYTAGEHDYENLVVRRDLDGVVIATPWIWHTLMAIAAMQAGKYAGVEMPAAITLRECWDLVDVSEQTGMPCMMLENVCYRRDVMAILNMVRKGLFGELIHMQCGYQHDLRGVKFSPGVEFGKGATGEARWRTGHSIYRNGDLYPTHGLGPVAQMLNINRGNRMVSLTSMATKSRGLHQYIVDHAGEDHPNADIEFKLGDIVSTLIETAGGETILISHDTNLPRPYSLGFRVQGTGGIWMVDGNQIYLEEHAREEHQWEDASPWLQRYDHPLWKRYEKQAAGSGHGGMDFFVMNAFIESIRKQVMTPLDVYDAASWSVISHLSEQSIARGGEVQSIPDFTRGRWMKRQPTFALNDQY